MSDGTSNGVDKKKGPLNEIIQPFIDLYHAPRALWGINLAYVIEGMAYFGVLGYLAMHFSGFIFQGVEHSDEYSHNMVMVLTAGITLAMFFLGVVADKRGVRFALVLAFVFMLLGRGTIAGAPNLFGLEPTRPGVFAGDMVSLHVTELDTKDESRVITKATVIANDEGGADVGADLAIDLAAGEGIAPSKELEFKLVKVSKATVVIGEDNSWKVQYGSAPVTARLLARSAEGQCVRAGAVISLDGAHITARVKEKAGDEEDKGDKRAEGDVQANKSDEDQDEDDEEDEVEYEYVIQCHWAEDFGLVDVSHCLTDTDTAILHGLERLESSDSEKVEDGVSKLLKSNKREELTSDILEVVRSSDPEEWTVQVLDLLQSCEQQEREELADLIVELLKSNDPQDLTDEVLELLPSGSPDNLRGRVLERLASCDRQDFADRVIEVLRLQTPSLGWDDHLVKLLRTSCKKKVNSREDGQKVKDRWPVVGESEAVQAAETVDIAAIRNMDDGPVDVVLRDVYVSYVRNGGYFLQVDRDGPAVSAFVNPVGSSLHWITMLGILLVVCGYGLYQPAAYAGVRMFTTPKTAAMGFAMLYALMNLGGWLPSFAFLLRDEDFLNLGISGVYWFYTGCTLLALMVTIFILSRKTVAKAIATAKEQTAAIEAAEGKKEDGKTEEKEIAKATPSASVSDERRVVPPHMWVFALAVLGIVFFKVAGLMDNSLNGYFVSGAICSVCAVAWIVVCAVPATARWVANHPLSNLKFFFFIFALIPVQTLFTYNWLILPQYINRAFEGWIGEYFEVAANANPILIFIAVPLIAAATQKAKVYNMMIYGTFIMAAPAFLLVIGPYWWTLAGYLLIMTIGEAMWQPRFLQYAAQIAPEGQTGMYMGVAQLPWFATKFLVPWLYSGWMMDNYCPADGERNTQFMWLLFACLAMLSTVFLILAKRWVGRDFKTKAA